MDNIDYVIICHSSSLSKYTLLRILNSILKTDLFPADWRNYRVFFFIPKGSSTKFRPISISSCLCKTMERMLANRLNWWLEYYNLLPSSQYGFRKQRSCIDNLSILYNEIIESFQLDTAVSSMFVDIQSAYDNVLSDILVHKLQKLGIPPLTVRFIYNRVSARHLTCSFGELEKDFWVFRDLPQGSVLSSLFYTLYVNNLDKACALGCKIIQYADDVCLFSSSYPLQIGFRSLKRSTNNMVSILNDLGLTLSAEKTQLCIFSRFDKELKVSSRVG